MSFSFDSGLFYYIPQAALGAIIISSVVAMVDLEVTYVGSIDALRPIVAKENVAGEQA